MTHVSSQNWSSQAIAYLATEQYEAVIQLCEQVMAGGSNQGAALYGYAGLALLLQGQALEAQTLWLAGLAEVEPAEVETWTAQLLMVLGAEADRRLQAGENAQAQQIYAQMVEWQPQQPEVWKALALVAIRQQQWPSAIACYQEALQYSPGDGGIYTNLGVIYKHQGDWPAAIACYQRAIQLDPGQIPARNNLGDALFQQGQVEAAIVCYQQLLELAPTYSAAHYNLGVILQGQGQFAAAVDHYQQAVAQDPSHGQAWYNLGLAQERRGEFAQARLAYERAIALQPEMVEANWNYALLLLRLGEWEEGFRRYEWRWRKQLQPRSFSQPLWDGSDLAGKTILLHAEQGFGDTLQFIRYVPLVAERGGKVILEAPDVLLPLLQTITDIDHLIPTGAELPPFQVQAPLMSLPRILGTTLANLPATIPYITVPIARPPLAAPPETRLKVGITWAGRPDYPEYRSRSCRLQDFLPLLQIPGIAFYSLQKGFQVEELAQLPVEVALEDLSPQLQDFGDTAAVMAHLDLVITTDTAVAHLAGALGRPVWVLLAQVPDWRWLVDREDSPWYPGWMRLFRQQQSQDWASVFDRVSQELQALLSRRPLSIPAPPSLQ